MISKRSHSFIVRVWIEPREVSNAPTQWRGMVQDVFNGDQRYFDCFDQMVDFIVGKFDFLDQTNSPPENPNKHS